VRDEIAELAPIFIEAGTVTESKFGDSAVSTRALASGAVTSPKIAAKALVSEHYADESIPSTALEFGCVTADKAGVGVVTSVNSAGDPVMMTLVVLTAAAWAAIAVPDPNTLYYLT
jgi:hypothetical protein